MNSLQLDSIFHAWRNVSQSTQLVSRVSAAGDASVRWCVRGCRRTGRRWRCRRMIATGRERNDSAQVRSQRSGGSIPCADTPTVCATANAMAGLTRRADAPATADGGSLQPRAWSSSLPRTCVRCRHRTRCSKLRASMANLTGSGPRSCSHPVRAASSAGPSPQRCAGPSNCGSAITSTALTPQYTNLTPGDHRFMVEASIQSVWVTPERWRAPCAGGSRSAGAPGRGARAGAARSRTGLINRRARV
jgi:hypothetical protein